MKQVRLLLLILLLVVPALACDALPGAEPTVAPLPTATTAPPTATLPPATSTPESTATPVPSPTPPEAAFVPFESEAIGVTLEYPAGWFLDESSYYVNLASDAAVLDTDTFTGGAVVQVSIPGDTDGLNTYDLLNQLVEDASNFLTNEEEPEAPVPVNILGQEGVRMTLYGATDDGLATVLDIVVIEKDGVLAEILTATSVAEEEQFRPLLERIINSVEITGTPTGGTGPEVPAGELIQAELGSSFIHEFPAGSYQEYALRNLAGTTIAVTVLPDSEMDAVIELYRAANLDEQLAYVDNSLSGGEEVLNYTLTDNDEYRVRVREFYSGAGSYEIGFGEGVNILESASPLAPGQTVSGNTGDDTGRAYLVEALAGEPLVLLATTADENLDLVLTIYDADGNEIDNIDAGFSGDPELLVQVPDTDTSFVVTVSGFGGSAGDFELRWVDLGQAYSAEGSVASDGQDNYRVCVPAGEGLIAILVPLDEDFDPTLNILGAGGGSLLDNDIDNGFSGQPEAVYFSQGAQFFSEDYPLIVAVRGFGGQGGNYQLFILSTGGDGVVPDGC